jgi:small subunit ribosomal protein S4
MPNNKKARGKIVRRLGVNIFGNPKFDRLLEKKAYPPGQHGRRRMRISDYGTQLAEKQKLRFCYGLSERQFRTLFDRAKAKQGITGDVMMELLERRLDNVIYRLGMAATRVQARQLAKHGHFCINGRKVSTPSITVAPDDKITVRKNERSERLVKEQVESGKRDIPPWMVLDEKSLSALIIRDPAREEIPTIADEQLVVEFYSK